MAAGSITKGGQPQLLVGAYEFRRGLSFQNESAGDLRLLQGGVDASPTSGIRVAPSAYYETPTNRYAGGSWSVYGDTDGQAFTWEVW